MDEVKMREARMEFERRRAKLGLRAALPDDKKRRKTREPLTRYELHVLTFMRAEGVMDLETLSGAMDETKQEMLEQLMSLIDRGYVKVISERGYARYKARGKDEL
jgi:predicted transcriptional regulator